MKFRFLYPLGFINYFIYYLFIYNLVIFYFRDDIEITFLVSAWRGQNACRLYLSRHERIHHLNLINKPIPEYLQLNKNTYNKKNDNKQAQKQVEDKQAEKQAQNDNTNGKQAEVSGEESPVSKKAKLSGQDENDAKSENAAK